MPLQLLWCPGLAAGRAILKIEPAAPGPVTLQIGNLPRLGEAAVFLHPHLEESQVWQPEPWAIVLPPDLPVTAVDNGLELEVGPELLWHLKPGRQYQGSATVAGGERVGGRLTFPKGLLLPGQRPERWTMSAPPLATPAAEPPTVPAAVTPVAAARSEPARPADESAAPAVAPVVAPVPMAPLVPSTGGRGKLVAGAVAACVVLAGVGYFFFQQPRSDPPATADAAAAVLGTAPAPGADMTLAGVRSFLASSPAPEAARQQAEKLAVAGQLPDGQFLLHRYAAEKGDAASARSLAGFYDPATWSADKSPLPAPNPVEAARWYERAAEAGDVESQYRYGMLLRSGRTDEADGPERSVAWLNKAAGQGHAAAKQALGQ